MKAARYTMKVTAQRTGLTAHVIRMWERRYEAVAPIRTSTGRRLYSDADLERLQLLRNATLNGHSISHVASLATEKLRQLLEDDQATMPILAPQRHQAPANPEPDIQRHLNNCLAAVEQLDAAALEDALARASVSMGQAAIMDYVLEPLMEKISESWRAGTLRIAHEHLATAVIRAFLGGLTRYTSTAHTAPAIIVTTPSGQMHELGALMAAATAAAEGWRVLYMGADMPAEEIALAAQQSAARVVALSIVYPADDLRLGDELHKLKAHLPNFTTILVGGRAAASYASVLNAVGALRINDMLGLRHQLELLRTRLLPHLSTPSEGELH
ncbi:MAG: cobalamin B12-binding domain-containing protein [Abitibacteriaceae bacterium]|nr:cobalamin B12-binding domain-containing protein [Abditibacteriaceae bacterium]